MGKILERKKKTQTSVKKSVKAREREIASEDEEEKSVVKK